MIELKIDHSHSENQRKSAQYQYINRIEQNRSNQPPKEQLQSKNPQIISPDILKLAKRKQLSIPGINMSQILFPALLESEQSHSQILLNEIINKIRMAQDKVYLAKVGDCDTYLHRAMQNIHSEYTIQTISDLLEEIQERIFSQIWNGEQEIRFKKSKNRDTQLLEVLRRKLKSNIYSLRSNMDGRKCHNSKSLDLADENIEDFQKKKASHFIRKIVLEKNEFYQKRDERIRCEAEKRAKSKEQNKEIEKQLRQDHHSKIKIRYEKSRSQKQEYIHNAEKNKKQYQSFLAEYRKKTPLFKKIQKQFANQFILKDQHQRNRLLTKIKEQRKPMDPSELEIHEHWYFKMRQQNEENRKSDMKKRLSHSIQTEYYKCRIHSLVSELNTISDDHFAVKAELRKKQEIYANRIVMKFRPKPNQGKKRQLIELQQKRKWAKKLTQRGKLSNSVQDGHKNFQKLKDYNNQMRAKGRIVTQRASKTIETHTSPYRNYLSQLRQSKLSKNERYSSINYNSMADNDIDCVQVHVSILQESVKRREKYLRNADRISKQDQLLEKTKLNQTYLEAAKAKIALLTHLK